MTVLAPGRQWVSHCGERARLRAIRQSFRRVEKMRDAASVAALARLRASVADEPDPQFGTMQLAHSALLAAEGTCCTWAEAITYLLDRFDERANGAPAE